MRFHRPAWLTHSGEKKDFEVYSCHVSPDGTRLVTAAGGDSITQSVFEAEPSLLKHIQMASSEYGPQRPSTAPVTLGIASPDSLPT